MVAGRYVPDPNPPAEPKQCQRCGTFVDARKTDGWWLEREHWQSPNDHVLFCMSCCVAKMNEWPNHPDVKTKQEARDVLYRSGNQP